MPYAIMHILVPLVLMALVKDWYDSKHKKKFHLHYVLIAGLAGLIPDIDIIAFWVLHFFGYSFDSVHKTFAHTLFVPLLCLILFFMFYTWKDFEIGLRKLKLSVVLLMCAFGSFMHLVLDGIFGPSLVLFYPFSALRIGINLAGYLPVQLSSLFVPSLEAAILVFWLIYLEWRHKISDFI